MRETKVQVVAGVEVNICLRVVVARIVDGDLVAFVARDVVHGNRVVVKTGRIVDL